MLLSVKMIPMKRMLLIAATVLWCCGIACIAIVLYQRVSASQLNRTYFSCSLNGKEQEMVNCDKRSKQFSLSWDEVSFISSEGVNAIYLPFTSELIQLQIDADTKAAYEFWVLYDTWGWQELQRVDNEIIIDTSPEQLKASLANKLNDNFFFEKDKEGRKLITIDTTKTILTQQGKGQRENIKNTSLVQGKNPKGVILMMLIPQKDQKVWLKKIALER